MSEQPAEPSEQFQKLIRYMRDPDRAQVADQWARVVQSELGPAARADAERMAPIVRRYLSKEIDREQYEQELAAATVPMP